jgi:hypothetical protein
MTGKTAAEALFRAIAAESRCSCNSMKTSFLGGWSDETHAGPNRRGAMTGVKSVSVSE